MKSILIVDDSATMRKMVLASLQGLGDTRLEQAANGLEAIESLALKPTDLVILDLNMPDIHGMEVLHFMRKHGAYRAIPVIVLTTRSSDDIRQAALEAGASAYMTKPFDPGALAQQARALIGEDR